jgi:hypothetical protein
VEAAEAKAVAANDGTARGDDTMVAGGRLLPREMMRPVG